MCLDWEVFESKGVRIKRYHCTTTWLVRVKEDLHGIHILSLSFSYEVQWPFFYKLNLARVLLHIKWYGYSYSTYPTFASSPSHIPPWLSFECCNCVQKRWTRKNAVVIPSSPHNLWSATVVVDNLGAIPSEGVQKD